VPRRRPRGVVERSNDHRSDSKKSRERVPSASERRTRRIADVLEPARHRARTATSAVPNGTVLSSRDDPPLELGQACRSRSIPRGSASPKYVAASDAMNRAPHPGGLFDRQGEGEARAVLLRTPRGSRRRETNGARAARSQTESSRGLSRYYDPVRHGTLGGRGRRSRRRKRRDAGHAQSLLRRPEGEAPWRSRHRIVRPG